MPAGQVQGPREGPTVTAKSVLGDMQDKHQAQAAGRERAEFIEDIYRESRYKHSIWETWKGRQLCLYLGSGVFSEDCSLVYMSSQASGNQLEQGQCPRCPS